MCRGWNNTHYLPKLLAPQIVVRYRPLMDNKVRTNRVDWDHWLNIPTVTLWQAVALSMDIDPDDEQRINIREGGLNTLITSPDKDIKFRKRLKLLIAHVYDTNHLHVRNREKIKYANSVIYLNSFADFALIIDWDIPKELTLLRTPVGDKVLSNNRSRSNIFNIDNRYYQYDILVTKSSIDGYKLTDSIKLNLRLRMSCLMLKYRFSYICLLYTSPSPRD